MDFFGIGPMEILLILVVALIIFGPGRLPEIARKAGKAMRTVRKATFDLTAEVTKELEGKEGGKPPGQARKNSGQNGESARHTKAD